MQWIFYCPKCGAAINPGGVVTLIASRGSVTILLGFNPEPGNYDLFLPPGIALPPGTEWSFSCPVCRADLASAEHDKLCELVLMVGTERRRLLFSRIAGEQATYVLRGDAALVERHGEHSDRYDDTVRLKRQRPEELGQ
ncbi:MAG: hypothetical protein M0R80_09070 [Proteobacteria bacterium]|jgi:hypothetical protein|nr:hypothetical protein [Pseudomonadota bacterium]